MFIYLYFSININTQYSINKVKAAGAEAKQDTRRRAGARSQGIPAGLANQMLAVSNSFILSEKFEIRFLLRRLLKAS